MMGFVLSYGVSVSFSFFEYMKEKDTEVLQCVILLMNHYFECQGIQYFSRLYRDEDVTVVAMSSDHFMELFVER